MPVLWRCAACAFELTVVLRHAATRRLRSGPASQFRHGHAGVFDILRRIVVAAHARSAFQRCAGTGAVRASQGGPGRNLPEPVKDVQVCSAPVALMFVAILTLYCSGVRSLDEVFQCAGNKKRDFSRRGSSGNWTEDQLTWKEEMSFKRRMGYATGMSEATPRSAQGGSRT